MRNESQKYLLVGVRQNDKFIKARTSYPSVHNGERGKFSLIPVEFFFKKNRKVPPYFPIRNSQKSTLINLLT